MDLISTGPDGDSIFIYDNLNPGDHFICFYKSWHHWDVSPSL